MDPVFVGIILAATSLQSPCLGAIQEGRSAVQDEQIAEVCGLMEHGQIEAFQSESAAKAAGAARTIPGPCFDED